MSFAIHKKPTKVTLSGLVGVALYLLVAYGFFRNNEYYPLILMGFFISLLILFVKSVGSYFISSIDVSEESIKTVTGVGGIIEIRFDQIDKTKTKLSELGLLIVPINGESLLVSTIEYSHIDIDKLAHKIGLDGSGKYREI